MPLPAAIGGESYLVRNPFFCGFYIRWINRGWGGKSTRSRKGARFLVDGRGGGLGGALPKIKEILQSEVPNFPPFLVLFGTSPANFLRVAIIKMARQSLNPTGGRPAWWRVGSWHDPLLERSRVRTLLRTNSDAGTSRRRRSIVKLKWEVKFWGGEWSELLLQWSFYWSFRWSFNELFISIDFSRLEVHFSYSVRVLRRDGMVASLLVAVSIHYDMRHRSHFSHTQPRAHHPHSYRL